MAADTYWQWLTKPCSRATEGQQKVKPGPKKHSAWAIRPSHRLSQALHAKTTHTATPITIPTTLSIPTLTPNYTYTYIYSSTSTLMPIPTQYQAIYSFSLWLGQTIEVGWAQVREREGWWISCWKEVGEAFLWNWFCTILAPSRRPWWKEQFLSDCQGTNSTEYYTSKTAKERGLR